MNSEITAFARGLKCGGLGSSSESVTPADPTQDAGPADVSARQQTILAQQVEQRQPADPHAGFHPEFPPGDELPLAVVIAAAADGVAHRNSSYLLYIRKLVQIERHVRQIGESG